MTGTASGSSSAGVGGVDRVRPAADTSAVLGIPESEFTPRVRDAIMKLMTEVDALRQELGRTRKRLEELETEADQDPLLPIFNRRAFVREMSRIMSFAERYGMPASLLYFDLDEFKGINDAHGHAAGDAVLKHVARLLSENIRESDIVGRLGGDEFGVILAKADEAAAMQKADVLADLIRSAPAEWDGKRLSISCTHGASTLKPGDNADHAMERADRAMYERKRRSASSR
ncbi:MAG: GGDEF domain-containing protein [Alphaproteobacteria bacterium]|nr:GGDEF domain-containing protein [Alphaproteobacteria bacterium]